MATEETLRRTFKDVVNSNRQNIRNLGENKRRTVYNVYVHLKNRKQQCKRDASQEKYSLTSAVGGLLKVVLDWVIDIIIATSFFLQGRYYVGALSLLFVFFGGAIVTFTLNKLIRRKGDEEFKQEIEETSPILRKLMYVPSLQAFFSSGLNIYLVKKFNSAESEEEREDIRRRLKICEEHIVTDALFENTFEAIPQAILQTIILLERPEFTRIMHFIPLAGVTSAWIGISMVPIQLAKSLNNIKVRIPEVIAGLGNKAVTLLSFVFFISASRKYFADPNMVTWELVGATLVSIVVLAIFSELPGLFSFRVDVGAKKGLRIRRTVDVISNLIWIVIPVASFCFWGVTLYEREEIHQTRFIVATAVFIASFAVSFIGCMFERKLPWLGQFSTDILLLMYIAIISYFRGAEFQDIDFQFEPEQDGTNVEMANSETNNNNEDFKDP